MKFLSSLIMFVSLLAITGSQGVDASDISFTYQGVLTDSSGNPMTGTFDMEFGIFDVLVGGTALYSQGSSVEVDSDGLFSVVLGPMSSDVFSGLEARYLEIALEGETLSPRSRITESPLSGVSSSLEGDLTTEKSSITAIDTTGDTIAVVRSDATSTEASFSVETSDLFDNFLGKASLGVAGLKFLPPLDFGELQTMSYSLSGTFAIDTTGDTIMAIGSDGWMETKSLQTDGFNMPTGAVPGYVLTVDEFGFGTWQPPSGTSGLWELDGSVVQTVNYHGIARGSAGNALIGDSARTQVNLGVACTTGTVGSAYTTISGGFHNVAPAWAATITGGVHNRVAAPYSVITGGATNLIDGSASFIGSGFNNLIVESFSVIAGGENNLAGGKWSSVLGGSLNSAEDTASTVLGGYANEARAAYSLAAGFRAKAGTRGAFVWADTVPTDFQDEGAASFNARATGGFYFYTGVDATLNPSTGAILASGSGTWASASDRNLKENFEPVDGASVLQRINRLPITRWNYKSQSQSVTHMGPTAQDFHAAFGLGTDDKHIATVDADGVALAGIQELSRKLEAKSREVDELKAEVKKLKAMMNHLVSTTGANATNVSAGK